MGKYFTHIKIALVVFLLIFIVMDMCRDGVSTAKIEDVTKSTVKAADMEGVTLAKNRMIRRLYGLNPNDYEGAVLYAPQDNMDVQELFIVKLKDISQKEAVEAAVKERLDTQLKSFEGYGAEQVALLKKHVLVVKGNYVFYMVGENTRPARKAFLHSL